VTTQVDPAENHAEPVDPATLIDGVGTSAPRGVHLDADVITAACSLLGAVVWRGDVAVRLVEVEAYDGPTDPASHAHKGCTSRNWVMFGPPGHLYVYISYGIHHAANVAACPDGRGSGVLLRAGQVISGIDVARRRRGPTIADRDLARGPGRLTQALGITRSDNGTDVLGSNQPAGDHVPGLSAAIVLSEPTKPVGPITNGPRVGVSKAADRPWRFWIAGDRYVSDYRPATRRRR
jgi:DNA-3-methyladenine glycosylase